MKKKNVPIGIVELKAVEKSFAKNARHFSAQSSTWQPKVLMEVINKASPNFKPCWEISHEMHSISPAQKFGMTPINRSGEKL